MVHPVSLLSLFIPLEKGRFDIAKLLKMTLLGNEPTSSITRRLTKRRGGEGTQDGCDAIISTNNSPNKNNKYAFLSLIIGLLSIFPVMGIVAIILSIIFGWIVIKNNARKGLAITGIAIAVILAIVINGLIFMQVRAGQEKVREYKNSSEYQNRVRNEVR